MVEVFFYGMFMDPEVLAKLGFEAEEPRSGFLDNHDLRIGERVTLVPSNGRRAYGVLMRMSEDSASRLYSLDIVAGYERHPVRVQLEDGRSVEALCYLLPESDLVASNPDYAQALYELCERLGFPADYLAAIDAYR